MLIEFSVANYRSFWETQTLKMTAAAGPELRESNVFSPGVAGLPDLLRSAVVYGPNAAGKSNLIRALAFMRRFVLESAKEKQEGEAIGVRPFMFNKEGKDRPSEFEVIFLQDGVRYQYGFAATPDRVRAEWLFAYPEGRAQRWFERLFDAETEREEWHFGSKFGGRKKLWQEATRSNALFLSTAIQLNNEQLKPVFQWFRNLAIIGPGTLLDPGFTTQQCGDEDGCRRIIDFLNAADLSIQDIHLEKRTLAEDELPADLPDKIKKKIVGKEMVRPLFLHPVAGSESMVSLPLEEESDGTRKLFAYAGPWLDILAKGRILLVDELNNSLHPKMVRFLLSLLHSNETNYKNGQVIFSTHDTNLLDQEIMRRDQIWFVEKNRENATRLYPLSDFSPRKKEALEKNYLHGRYGALPYLRKVA